MEKDEKKTILVQIRLSPSEVEDLDDIRRSQPLIPSRSEIVRRMIRDTVARTKKKPRAA